MKSLCEIKGYMRAMFACFKKATELGALRCDKQYLPKAHYEFAYSGHSTAPCYSSLSCSRYKIRYASCLA